jgi:hypothetical protein
VKREARAAIDLGPQRDGAGPKLVVVGPGKEHKGQAKTPLPRHDGFQTA